MNSQNSNAGWSQESSWEALDWSVPGTAVGSAAAAIIDREGKSYGAVLAANLNEEIAAMERATMVDRDRSFAWAMMTEQEQCDELTRTFAAMDWSIE